MSGKKVKAARKAAPKKSIAATAPRELELVTPRSTLQLDLACGQTCREGFDGVDLPGVPAHMDETIAALRAKARTPDEDKTLEDLIKGRASLKHEVNLLRFPWPWADSSVSAIHCSHFIEHIPMEFVDEFGNYVPCGTPGAQDLFLKFFDECWRILIPDGWMEIFCPNARSNRGYQDPTHRRFIVAESFFYLFKGFRDGNKLDHYNVRCDFDGPINPGIYADHQKRLELRTDEVRVHMLNSEWNIVADWHAKLRAIKTPTTMLPSVLGV